MSAHGDTVEKIREKCGKVNRKNKIAIGPRAIGKELKLRRPRFEKIYEEAVTSFGEMSHEAAVARYFLATSLVRTEEFKSAEQLFRTNLSVFKKIRYAWGRGLRLVIEQADRPWIGFQRSPTSFRSIRNVFRWHKAMAVSIVRGKVFLLVSLLRVPNGAG